jgi:CubicO group peptidase (beta-lactamase class C family)
MKKTILLVAVIFIAGLLQASSLGDNNVVIANDTCKAIDNYLTKLSVEKSFSGALLIVQNGKKVFSKGYGWANKELKIPFTPSTLASMGSITKAFTAAAVLKLAEQQKLSVNDSLKKFFPGIPSDKSSITIHHLLTHSSGFHEFLQNDGGDYEKIETDAFLERAFSEPLSFKPGEKAVYTNVGMSILAIIIEKVSGMAYEAFLKKELFTPAGIKGIGYHYPAADENNIAVGYRDGKRWGTHQQRFKEAGGGPYWNLKGNGGLEVSLDDMFLWVNAVTNHVILNDSSVEKMFTPYIQEENSDASFGYGCNITRSRRGTKVVANGGSNGIYFAKLVRLPQEGLIFYLVTNESSVNANMIFPNVAQLYFEGKIIQDALSMKPDNALAKKVYELVTRPSTTDLHSALAKENMHVDDDMVLLDVGRKLMEEKKTDKALILYTYYTEAFPNIVVAWNDLGDVYREMNKKQEAIKCYEQALKLRPGNPRATDNLKKLQE